eukprot:1155582-Pelagomonas_calceolata.AAC.2
METANYLAGIQTNDGEFDGPEAGQALSGFIAASDQHAATPNATLIGNRAKMSYCLCSHYLSGKDDSDAFKKPAAWSLLFAQTAPLIGTICYVCCWSLRKFRLWSCYLLEEDDSTASGHTTHLRRMTVRHPNLAAQSPMEANEAP